MPKWLSITGIVLLVIYVFLVVLCYDDNAVIEQTVYPEPTTHFFVEDYSGVLNEPTERYIFDEAVRLYEQTSAQVVVVMVPNTHCDSLEEYSIALANSWGIGDAAQDNGILLLFVTDEDDPHVRMEVGDGLAGTIPDGKAGRILDDYAVEPKEEGQWNKAAANTATAVIREIYGHYEKECPESVAFADDWGDSAESGESAESGGSTFADADFPEELEIANEDPFFSQVGQALADAAFILFFVLFFIVFIIVCVFLDLGSGGGGGSSGGSSGGGGYSGGGGSFSGGGASR